MKYFRKNRLQNHDIFYHTATQIASDEKGWKEMPVLIYMESAYRRADGTGVIRCEAMLPGDGQATISKVVRDTTARQMTREKLLLLAELLQNGVPDSNGERRKLRHVEILVYTTDQAFWDDLRIQADAEMTNSPQQSRNSDVCAQIIRQCRDNGCRLRNMGNSLLQKLVRSEAYRYLENQEVSPNDGTGKIA
ncbi:hypothetical protein [Ruthenibacterium lactatiformans]|uniref:hypothetical protein n=2 Tax=Ruthenibacterium lactatiformans TaxID=1550024 RepID=UPI0039A3C1E5